MGELTGLNQDETLQLRQLKQEMQPHIPYLTDRDEPIVISGIECHSADDMIRASAREKREKRSNIPLRYLECRFDNLKTEGCPNNVRPMAEEAYRYGQHLKEHIAKGEGLIFSGTAGLMKTTLACCIAQKAIDEKIGVYFISMPELLDNLVSMARNRDPMELRTFEDRIRHVSLLILDDFGAEYPSGWVLNKVDAIITNRYNNLKPVIITTNLLKGEMQERYVTRVFDRLRSTNKLLTAAGDSLRPSAGESRKK